jgi:hypothetical protein
MEPLKVGAPIQTTRKTRSILRAPHETAEAEQETTQREAVVDVDAIPSPQIEPVSTIVIEEEEQAPMMNGMEVDSHDSAQDYQTRDAGNLQQSVRAEVAQRKNGDTSKQTEAAMSRPQLGVGSVQQQEGLVEDITGYPDLGA